MGEFRFGATVKVLTSWHEDGRIVQRLARVNNRTGEAEEVFAQHIVRTQDEGVRRALVGLGWTPPGVNQPNSALSHGRK